MAGVNSYNSGIGQVMVHFDVSIEVALLGMSLFLFGYTNILP